MRSALLFVPALLLACGGGSSSPPIDAAPVANFCTPGAGTSLDLQLVANGLSRPLFVAAPAGDTRRLFIVQQRGRIRLYQFETGLLPTDFLDLSENGLDKVSRSGNERGLLGLAFHPDYNNNRRFFVHYTDRNNGDSVVSEFKASEGNPDVADTTETEILRVSQPYSNHNAGMLAFGPDGFLYIGLGDGGSGGDPDGNGQNNTTLLGSMLRIDVNSGSPYSIPSTNPYASSANGPSDPRPEIWAIGLRNPWRFSFDRSTGDLYIGDVGQGAREEVTVQPASSSGGENYGWRAVEGTICYENNCDMNNKIPPVHDYDHSSSKCSITGGYVYRGSCIPDIQGWYFFADYCTNQVWKLEYSGGAAQNVTELTDDLQSGQINGISSFGEDGAGELYITDLDGGQVFRIVRQGASQ
jgi:glucose/arabinose dehydrogenase